MVKAIWNDETGIFNIEMTAEELAANIIALEVASNITKDEDIINLKDEYIEMLYN